LKNVFTEVNGNKAKFTEKHLQDLTDLKDQMKTSLSDN
jgi:hypothetical protein